MKKLATLLMIIGIAFLGVGIYQYVNIQIAEKKTHSEAEELLARAYAEPNKEIIFEPEIGDAIGLLNIDKIDASIAIIEGTDPEELKHGVGHMAQTALPGENDQILLSGHRDTVFTRLGEVEIGDIIEIKLPYGTFEYEMVDSIIVSADDTSVIGSTAPNEELVISTCYPFGYIGSAPDRYVIYAVPVEK
ncbi:class D sortase [Amphibacillus indicireducens]|uniref:Sortase SrtA n=1 Tax=Amphibacillus indicireducens TaxID=1076330 RepID=A0ABP7VQP4_9BACI